MTNCCTYEFKKRHFGFTDSNAEDFYVAQCCTHKIPFIIYRTIICLYWLAWVIEGIVEYSYLENGHFYYVYLSHWNEWVLVVYLVISLMVAIYGLKDSEASGKVRWNHKMSWIVRNTGIVSSYLVTAIFYGAGVTSRTSLISSIHRHAVSSALYTIDLFVSRVPVRLLHFIYPSLFFICYAIFTLILHAANVRSQFYEGILDWEQIPGFSAGIFIGVVLLVTPILHSVVFVFYYIKTCIAQRCCNSVSNGSIPAKKVTCAEKHAQINCDSIA